MEDDAEGLSAKAGLPPFLYHPDPLATGSVKASDARCAVCEQTRGYIYVASTYCLEELEGKICPWCISDESAAKRFEAMFSDDHSLKRASMPEAVIREVTRRTPGYISWQGEDWKSCCGDACEFHGNPSREHLLAINPSAIEQILSRTRWSTEEWKAFVTDRYEPGGSPAVYHFVCRHCKKPQYGFDFD